MFVRIYCIFVHTHLCIRTSPLHLYMFDIVLYTIRVSPVYVRVCVCVCFVNHSIPVRAFLNEFPGLGTFPRRDLAVEERELSTNEQTNEPNGPKPPLDREHTVLCVCASRRMHAFTLFTRLLSHLLTHATRQTTMQLVGRRINSTLDAYIRSTAVNEFYTHRLA